MRWKGSLFWKTPLFPFAFTGLTGARGAIPESTLTAMRDSGLAHLLAISGLHVGLVAGLLFFGVRALLALVPALAISLRTWRCTSSRSCKCRLVLPNRT
jgi:predicted membrane metal-binding protein